MLLSPFFRALPLALPLMIASAVVATVACRPAGERLRCGPIAAWMLICGFGAFAALTLTPTDSSLAGYSSGSTRISLSVSWPDMHRLTSMTSESLNLVAGVFLGLGSGAVARRSTRLRFVAAAVAAPIVAELSQWALPGLGRSGFLMTDVVVNWVGIALGVLAGTLAFSRALTAGTTTPEDVEAEATR